MKLPYNSLRRIGAYYVFGGNAPGFSTSQQNEKFANSKDNSFVMKYLLDKQNSYSCIYEAPVPTYPPITQTVTFEAIDGTKSSDTQDLNQYMRFFQVYSSPYSGAFDLLDT